MTRPVVGLVLGALILAYGVRLVWLQDLFGVPSGQELVGLTILVALLLKQLLGIPLVDAPVARTAYTVAQPPAAKEIAMASDDDEMSFEEQFELLGGASERPPTMAAWGLHLHSPFAPPRAATSWFGGVPRTPADFDWPADAAGGRLHFVAQIDLAALTPVPGLGGPPPGLPRTGALLVFVGPRDEGKWTFAIRYLTQGEVAAGRDCPVPGDLLPPGKAGFWTDGQTFPRWPVDVVGFADDGMGRPNPLGPTTWGLVTYDLGKVSAALRGALQECARFAERIAARDPATTRPASAADWDARFADHNALILSDGVRLLAVVDALRARALAEDPFGEADPKALVDVTAARAALSGRLRNQPIKYELRPAPARLARDLIEPHAKNGDWQDMPEAYRAFVEPCITGWRGHRLFGKALPPTTYPEDLRGLDCLFSVLSDPILGTRIEHADGFSIWCDRAALARGDLSSGRLVWHICT